MIFVSGTIASGIQTAFVPNKLPKAKIIRATQTALNVFFRENKCQCNLAHFVGYYFFKSS
jgi:hypothetical protein